MQWIITHINNIFKWITKSIYLAVFPLFSFSLTPTTETWYKALLNECKIKIFSKEKKREQRKHLFCILSYLPLLYLPPPFHPLSKIKLLPGAIENPSL